MMSGRWNWTPRKGGTPFKAEDLIGMKKKRGALYLLALILIGTAAAALWLGRYPKLGWTRWRDLADDPIAANLFWRLRFPRVVIALLSGAVLSAGGLVCQTVFNNPLAGPDIVGVSQGAAIGAATAIIFFPGSAAVRQLAAFIGGGMGLILSLAIARRLRYGGWTLRFLLAGITVSAFFTGALTVLKLMADGRNQLHAIEFWMMGAYCYVTANGFIPVVLLALASLISVGLFRWRTNLFSLPDESSSSLGAALALERTLLISAAVVGISAVTSLSGIIGWVGLIIPHLARILFGADSRYALPGSILLGALITLFSDTAIRLFSPREIPVGFMTSLLCVLILWAAVLTRKIRF